MVRKVPRLLLKADVVGINGQTHVVRQTAEDETFCGIKIPFSATIRSNVSKDQVDCIICRPWFTDEAAGSQ